MKLMYCLVGSVSQFFEKDYFFNETFFDHTSVSLIQINRTVLI